MNKQLIKGYIFVIASAVIFGLMPLMAKFIYSEGVNPPTLVFLRNIISIPFLAILALLTKSSLKINKKAIPSISLIALMGCCITPLLLFYSYKHIPSGTATVFHFIYPAAVVTGEFVFLKNKMKPGYILSVIVCIIGIALFYNPNDNINSAGSSLALLSGITYATYILLLSSFRHKEISGFTFSFYVALVCSLAMLLICLFTKQLMLPLTLKGWLWAVVFAFSLNVGAVVLFQKGTFLIGGSRASILSTFEPITSIFAGALILNEKINLFTGIGTILVIGASILITLSDMIASNKNEI